MHTEESDINNDLAGLVRLLQTGCLNHPKLGEMLLRNFLSAVRRTFSTCGGTLPIDRRIVLPPITIDVKGCLTSCAIEAAKASKFMSRFFFSRSNMTFERASRPYNLVVSDRRTTRTIVEVKIENMRLTYQPRVKRELMSKPLITSSEKNAKATIVSH